MLPNAIKNFQQYFIQDKNHSRKSIDTSVWKLFYFLFFIFIPDFQNLQLQI